MRALSIAATGMSAQQMRVEVISNNLANMSTTGYSRAARRIRRPALSAVYPTRHGQRHRRHRAADRRAAGPRRAAVLGVDRRWQQGTLTQTGGDLDIAIDGRGYLRGHHALGHFGLYPRRRAEAVARRPDRHLGRLSGGAGHHRPRATRERSRSMPTARSMPISTTRSRRSCWARSPWPASPTKRGWRRSAATCSWKAPPRGRRRSDVPGVNGLGTLRQGYLEESSVDPVREITDLIEAQRGYEMNAKVITAADQMLAATTQVR